MPIITKAMRKLASTSALKATNPFKTHSIYIASFLKRLNQLKHAQGIDKFAPKGQPKVVNLFQKMGTTPNKLMNDILSNPQKVSKQLNKLSTSTRKDLATQINNTIGVGTIDSAPLSSSWLSWGTFTLQNGLVGELELTLKNGKTYHYAGVQLTTWTAMKAAKGSNGSGAGTVFWSMYLRGAQGSVTYKALQGYFGSYGKYATAKGRVS